MKNKCKWSEDKYFFFQLHAEQEWEWMGTRIESIIVFDAF